MIKWVYAILICLWFTSAVASQNKTLLLSAEQQIQIQQVLVRLVIVTDDTEIYSNGILVTASGLILTGLEALDGVYGGDITVDQFYCTTPNHQQVQIITTNQQRYRGCVVVDQFDHIFALLQIESSEDGTPLPTPELDFTPLDFDDQSYLQIGAAVYAPFITNQALDFAAGAVIALPIVGEGYARQRHYFTDVATPEPDQLGGPVIDEAGKLVGITVQISRDSNSMRTVTRVIPLATICRVNREVCQLITPDDQLPPTDRTQIPENAVLIEDGRIDIQSRATTICQQFGLSGQPADTASGWICGGGGTTQTIEITIPQIDDLCKVTYSDLDAFALLSGTEPERAYQWRCYRPR